MIYRAIGIMSGSSLDGLDIAFAEFQENAGKWSYELKQADCFSYSQDWIDKLSGAPSLGARDYKLLDAEYGNYIGEQVNRFIEKYKLQYQVALVSSHGHTCFHIPGRKMTAQLGEGAAIAATTLLPVVSDLRALDVAFGGEGAPIVPVGEKLLLGEYELFLNLGGIANISMNANPYLAFDVCPANRVLNMLAAKSGHEFDDEGKLASKGTVDSVLLEKLNGLEYYQKPAPKSLANDFGTDTIFPMLIASGLPVPVCLRTYVEHIVLQIQASVSRLSVPAHAKMLVTGGGAFNTFLVDRLEQELSELKVEIVLPAENLIRYKEALVMALMGVLRWRQEYNVFSSVTGAKRNSIGGALWTGQEA